MKNKSFTKKFLKAYIVCVVVILNLLSMGSFLILFLLKSWWCLAALFFVPVTVGMLAPIISDWLTDCDD